MEALLESDDLLELIEIIEADLIPLYENYFHVKFNLNGDH